MVFVSKDEIHAFPWARPTNYCKCLKAVSKETRNFLPKENSASAVTTVCPLDRQPDKLSTLTLYLEIF